MPLLLPRVCGISFSAELLQGERPPRATPTFVLFAYYRVQVTYFKPQVMPLHFVFLPGLCESSFSARELQAEKESTLLISSLSRINPPEYHSLLYT